jgi:hypothetical protein
MLCPESHIIVAHVGTLLLTPLALDSSCRAHICPASAMLLDPLHMQPVLFSRSPCQVCIFLPCSCTLSMRSACHAVTRACMRRHSCMAAPSLSLHQHLHLTTHRLAQHRRCAHALAQLLALFMPFPGSFHALLSSMPLPPNSPCVDTHPRHRRCRGSAASLCAVWAQRRGCRC